MSEIPKTLFLGLGTSVVAYYRCFLPAVALGADYAIWGDEDPVRFGGGFGQRPPRTEDLFDYEVVVVQYGSGKGWLQLTRQLQEAGVTVLYEIDDYVHTARKSKTHEMAHAFGSERLRKMEMIMRVADGMICSTSFIARRYRSFNPRTWECRNGIDLKRYEYRRPPHDGVTIGWAGGVGHKASLARWEPALRAVLRARPEARFVSVGHAAAALFVEEFGHERALSLPTAGIEVYPASMTLFDVSIAPSAENNQFRGKSDLRWLEASAIGIPLVAHPEVYPDIEDGVTGVHASTPEEVEAALLRLIDDADERKRIGATAHEYVAENRRIEIMAESWRDVLTEVRTPAVAS
jgi:glycosyltransferase involved in cell wall biosynthesis